MEKQIKIPAIAPRLRRSRRGGIVRVRPLFLASALAAVSVLVYAGSFQAPFVFDDIPNILDNVHIRMTRFGLDGLMDAACHSPLSRRPVANMTFALNYFFHGFSVAGYHVVNIAIHATTAVLLFLWLKITCRQAGRNRTAGPKAGKFFLPGLSGDKGTEGIGKVMADSFPFWVAMIWAVHPMHTQTVTYIVQRMNGLAAMFSILALYAYGRARMSAAGPGKWGFAILGVVAVVLALGSKENAATLPFFILLYEWYFFQDASPAWLRRQAPLLVLLGLAGLAVVFLFLGSSPVERILGSYAIRDFTLSQRVLTQFRVVVFYISLILFPHPSRLNLDHQFLLSHSLTDPATTLVAALALGAILGLSVVIFRRKILMSFAILWFLGNLLIESSVIGLELVFEHRTYLPSISVCLLVTLGICRCVRRHEVRVILLMAIVTSCGLWTLSRNEIWRSDLSLWADSAAKSPGKARPQNNLGSAYQRQGRLADAERHFRKALQLLPGYIEAHNNLGVVLAESGRIVEGIDQFRRALKEDPRSFLAHRNLGGVLILTGDLDAAALHLQQALDLRPLDAETLYLMGNVFFNQGEARSALLHFSRALKENPDHAGAHTNAGILLARAGRLAAAISHFKAAKQLRPGDFQARANLERALRDQKAGGGR